MKKQSNITNVKIWLRHFQKSNNTFLAGFPIKLGMTKMAYFDIINPSEYNSASNKTLKKVLNMQPIMANYTASITELKKSPTQILENAGDEVVAILNHNVASAYLVPSKTYEKLMEMLDDYLLSKEVQNRMKESFTPIKVSFDDL